MFQERIDALERRERQQTEAQVAPPVHPARPRHRPVAARRTQRALFYSDDDDDNVEIEGFNSGDEGGGSRNPGESAGKVPGGSGAGGKRSATHVEREAGEKPWREGGKRSATHAEGEAGEKPCCERGERPPTATHDGERRAATTEIRETPAERDADAVARAKSRTPRCSVAPPGDAAAELGPGRRAVVPIDGSTCASPLKRRPSFTDIDAIFLL
ncbi:PREDICTED: uncharacterized protein LOC106818735 [Priapulus caudatus]|uniref:Uncharacterized protein LOC106818735 n=1 Tax=Priapulus caudatus TaxID=37621 RepID=A0ABM1F372_PRICU|nr:PREDICTED: uncharacterized protein LOC106818735 [Priapulus caudatus]